MSRKGKFPISLPKGIEVTISGKQVTVKSSKGSMQHVLPSDLELKQEGDKLILVSVSEDPKQSKFHGLHRALLSNIVVGLSEGFEKKLEMIGVGYRAAVQGQKIALQVGLSHPCEMEIPQGLAVKVDKNTLIIISGSDKQAVGQFAASIRAVRPPEVYQGKGIRYQGEYVRKKAGKAAAK